MIDSVLACNSWQTGFIHLYFLRIYVLHQPVNGITAVSACSMRRAKVSFFKIRYLINAISTTVAHNETKTTFHLCTAFYLYLGLQWIIITFCASQGTRQHPSILNVVWTLLQQVSISLLHVSGVIAIHMLEILFGSITRSRTSSQMTWSLPGPIGYSWVAPSMEPTCT